MAVYCGDSVSFENEQSKRSISRLNGRNVGFAKIAVVIYFIDCRVVSI
jgi:hypothetical protein